jgi:hypothetical protein
MLSRKLRARLRSTPGKETGSKRLKSASLNHAEAHRKKREKPHE